MLRICILSDTHSYIDEAILKHAKDCDQVWHAGDIGSMQVLEQLENVSFLRAVSGNIDDHIIKSACPDKRRFICEGTDVFITHIGGYPGRYDARVLPALKRNPPGLFVTGHSHILKIMYDKKYNFLYINPGAIGKHGFHQVRTLVKLSIDKGNFSDLQVVEYPRR